MLSINPNTKTRHRAPRALGHTGSTRMQCIMLRQQSRFNIENYGQASAVEVLVCEAERPLGVSFLLKRLPSRNPASDEVGGTGRKSANDESLQGAAKGRGSSETSFQKAEDKECSKCDWN